MNRVRVRSSLSFRELLWLSANCNMIQEADCIRWGSVKRVTNLRKEEQDALWESVINSAIVLTPALWQT
jgi:hypothetical protein